MNPPSNAAQSLPQDNLITIHSQDNLITIHSFLKDSYSQAKQHITNGMSAFRDEVAGLYNRAESCLYDMTAPVNNFLKDFTQIDSEFTTELSRNAPEFEAFSAPFSNVIPIEQALRSPMEENY